ncbi:hypothetical protein [uncultured Endozoicomonas sp.]|uniref:hypothetical protein n=1 Tax=uncultured Endozoicomonas sp. TaxID=432652 RepID=UPI002634EAEA|nr:hypothetical protein [uncultured Endozoicomonas sp.]
MKTIVSAVLVSFALLLTGCAATQESAQSSTEVTRQFYGSTQNPDTVSRQTLELSKAGVLKNVRMTRSIPAQITATGPENVLSCISVEGNKWVAEHQECEYMDENTCTDLGGEFNACASACRNDPKAEICIMMCVPVCSFAK